MGSEMCIRDRHNHAPVMPKRRIMVVFAGRILAAAEAIMHDWIYSGRGPPPGPVESEPVGRVASSPRAPRPKFDGAPVKGVKVQVNNENPPVLVEHGDGITRITLNRPERLNAVDLELLDALAGALADAVEAGSRVAVIGGAGPALCVGCLLYTSPSPRDGLLSRMPSSA